MDKIEINNKGILKQIAEQLNIELKSIEDGITQEQSDAIEKLSIREDSTGMISNFKNLKKLTILGKEDVPKLHDITIADLPNLESLEVLGTKKVNTINLKTIPNVYYVNISGNSNLQEGENLITIVVYNSKNDVEATYQITTNKNTLDWTNIDDLLKSGT